MQVLFAPVAGVAEVAVDRTGGDLGDEWKAPLVLGGLNLGENSPDELFVEAGCDDLGDLATTVHHQMEDPIDLLIGKPELRLVGLPNPEVAAGRLSDDGLRDAHMTRQLPDL